LFRKPGRQMRRKLTAGTLLFGFLAGLVSPPVSADSYKAALILSKNPDNHNQYRIAKIEADVTPLAGGIVGLFRNNDDVGLPNGWSTFLYKPSAHSRSGQALNFASIGGGKYRLEGWTGGPVKLEYTMLLQHDRFPSDPGQDELAYARDFGVMWTGRALLMEGSPSANIDVRFDVPDDWSITAPWTEDPSDRRHFIARDTDALLDSAFMAGKQERLVEPLGDAQVRIGVDPAMKDKLAGLVRTLHQSVSQYESMFGDRPRDNVVIILAGASYTGGGVMGRSISFLIGPDYPDPKDFHHVLSHELFHLWTGRWSRTASQSQTEWLVEGGAEYYSYLSGLRAGRLSQEDFLHEIAERYAKYLASSKNETLAGAGAQKLQNSISEDAVYSGGMIALLTLDGSIRRQTRGRQSLDDFMRALNEAVQLKPLSLDLLDNLAMRFGVQGAFFRRYIAGHERLPFNQGLEGLGVRQTMAPAKGDQLNLAVSNSTFWRAYRHAKD
jgi:predicted metalloprotease with PDZ domain